MSVVLRLIAAALAPIAMYTTVHDYALRLAIVKKISENLGISSRTVAGYRSI